MSKKRLDIMLVEKGLVSSRSKAQALILAGEVYVKGQKVDKAGFSVSEDAEIELKSKGSGFVSRGGTKLSHALSHFNIDVTGFNCVDIGASTGGFTDCLLKNSASKVYSIDVGYGQLDWSLRSDDRVIVVEKMNIRDFDVFTIEEPIDIITIDVSFIGLEKVFPKVDEIFKTKKKDKQYLVTLIKPQFQVGREKVGKGGVIRDEAVRAEAIDIVKNAASSYGWSFQGVDESPIKGPKGNVEFVALWKI